MMNRIRSFLVDLKPSNITGGAPFYPLFVLFGLNAVDELDRTAFGVLIPEIRDHFSLDIQGVLTLVSVVGAVTLVLSVPIAYFADRWSRVRMATAGASVWSLFSVLTGLAPNVGTLGVARAGSGLGKAVNDPTHNSLISDYYDVSVRVKVFGFHRAANSVGQMLGPLLAGLLAYFFTWRTPFIVFAVPTLVFVVLALRLRDPVRGAPERRAMGADAGIVNTPEEPPTWAEAWRISWQVRSLRRIWFSLPFLAVSLIGLISLLSLYYEEVFGLNEIQRGTVQAIAEPGQIVGLAIGIPFAFRMAARGPGFLVKLLALGGVVQAGLFVVLIVAPNLVFAVTTNVLLSAVGAVLVPGIYATLSLTIPPRARATGFSLGILFALPGLIILVIIGGIADSAGLRPAMIVLVPVYLIGAFILASAGRFIAGDIDRIRTSTLARSQAMVGRREGKVKLLLVKDLDVSYDGVQVLFGVDMEVDEGEIVALLGTNGAGKSTLLRAISGLLEPDRGVVVFDGRDTTNMPPNDLVSRGIVQVPGGRGVFPSLTVEENLKIAGWLYRSDESYVKEAIARVHEYFPVLAERAGEQAGSLSGGEQQMLTLGQAFIARPKLLMIDELSLGLAPIVVSKLLDIVEAIREQGTTIILVEQSVNIALTVAQTAYFMEKGEIRFHGPTKELLSRPEILRSVFLKGSAAADLDGNGKRSRRRRVRVRRPVGERSVLEVEGLSKRFGGITAVDDVSLRLREHQILGVIGPNGAGKTSLFDLISGFLVPDAGSICLNDRDITSMGTDVRSRLGLGRSFQDARLFPGLTVREAIAVALDRRVAIKDPIAEALSLPSAMRSQKQVRQRVEEIIEATNLHAFRDKFISELSTGSRRIVEIACSLAHDPDVLLLDEPSSGIAQREVEELAGVLADLPSRVGASLLVIEHDMPLITKIADEMVAMDLGRVIARGKPAAVVKDPEVVTSYLGVREQVIKRSGALSAKRKPRAMQPAGHGRKVKR